MIIHLFIRKPILPEIVFGLFHIIEQVLNKFFMLIYLLKLFFLFKIKQKYHLELIFHLPKKLIYNFLYLEVLMIK